MEKKKSYAVCGLGAFGAHLAEKLAGDDYKYDVMACDIDPVKVNKIRDKVKHAVIADVSDIEAVKELDIARFDTVILSMSKYFEKQILALTWLKQEGAKRVYVKAASDVQGSILNRLGADKVIYPEHEVAERLCRTLSFDNISNIIDFKGEAIAEVSVPRSMHGKSLIELDLRGKYSITVLFINKPIESVDKTPGPHTVLERGDKLTVFGKYESIIELFKEK